jgi:2-polyprenyl-6-hydroxyphenyl methylase/3-demethylubiquinone-9 3-methyltransferase
VIDISRKIAEHTPVRHGNPLKYFSEYHRNRGMSVVYDWFDWLGGYPFEVGKPEEVFRFYKEQGYSLQNLATTNRQGCNEFLFKKLHNA